MTMANGNGRWPKYKTRDGEPVPSVTTLLGHLGWSTRGLMFWAHKLGRDGKDLNATREELADAGKLCHLFAQHDIKGWPKPPTDGIDPAIVKKATDSFEGYLAWKRTTQLELVASEVGLVSEELRFGGRLDAIAVFDGAARIVDWKSAKELYPDTIVQVAAYRQLWNENHPDMPVEFGHVVRWAPDGSYAHHALSARALDAGWRTFLHCLDLDKLKKELKP